MKMPTVVLVRLEPDDREQFILDNQEADLMEYADLLGWEKCISVCRIQTSHRHLSRFRGCRDVSG